MTAINNNTSCITSCLVSPSNDDIRHSRDDHLQTARVCECEGHMSSETLKTARSSLLMRRQWDHSILICSNHLHITLVNTEQQRFICTHRRSSDQSHYRDLKTLTNQFMSCRATEIYLTITHLHTHSQTVSFSHHHSNPASIHTRRQAFLNIHWLISKMFPWLAFIENGEVKGHYVCWYINTHTHSVFFKCNL